MLELDGVGFGYSPQKWTFRGVSFQVPPAPPRRCWARTAAERPRWCAARPDCCRRWKVPSAGTETAGYVPQAHGSAFAYPALEMVLMGRARQVRFFRSPGPADRAAALEAMDRIGIAELQDRLFPTLSGGEQQLVLLARAIAAGCPVLVLDEPATGLDLKNQARILTLLRELCSDGMTVLLSTHHPDHALYLADRVVLMGGSGPKPGRRKSCSPTGSSPRCTASRSAQSCTPTETRNSAPSLSTTEGADPLPYRVGQTLSPSCREAIAKGGPGQPAQDTARWRGLSGFISECLRL